MPTYARLQNADSVEVNDIRSVAAGAPTFSAGISLDTIAEKTAATGVTIDGLLIKDSAIPNLPFTDWVPTLTGFSANPTNSFYRYFLIGKLCCLAIGQTTPGTSNATSFTISLPFTAKSGSNYQWGAVPYAVVDNSVSLTTPAQASILSGGTTIVLAKSISGAGGGWTSSGGKGVGLVIFYEIA